jgi:hypothetical protein
MNGHGKMLMKIYRVWLGLMVLFCLIPVTASAWELAGTKTIYLHDREGQKIEAGSVEFKPEGTQIGFNVHWNHDRMKDYFLSMREFKCFEGKHEIQCQVPYPYQNPKTINTDHYAWLENHLLFLYKSPKEFGANLWNGIYYELKPTPTGLTGYPHAIDLVAIGAPPERLDVPPYPAGERTPMAEGVRWFTHLTIE